LYFVGSGSRWFADLDAGQGNIPAIGFRVLMM
jgi:hypothetical protein